MRRAALAPAVVFGMNTMFAVRQFLPEILELTRRHGFRPVVIAPGDDHEPGASSNLNNITLRPVYMVREISPLRDLLSFLQIWSILLWIRPQITNMSTPKMGLLGGVAALCAGVERRIYTLRGLRYETTQGWKRRLLVWAERVACACADQVICVSRSLKEQASRDGIAPPDKLLVLGDRVSEGISMAVEPVPERGVRSIRESLSIPPDVSVLGFVGRLTRDKGVPELVSCFETLRKSGHKVHLLVIGGFERGDPVDEATERLIRNTPEIHWLGYVGDARPYFEAMDIFVFPSHREGLGKVLLEAAAAGKPVVSTLTTGVVDIVQDGVTGLLVPRGDRFALTAAVKRLLEDSSTASQMGRAARALVESQFDNSIYLERLGRLLDSFSEQAVIQERSH